MKPLLKRYLVVTVSLLTLTQLINSVSITGGWRQFLLASFVLSLIIYIVKPILNLIMLPINLITLNMASWILTFLCIYLWTFLVRDVNIGPWQFGGLVLGSVKLTPFELIAWQAVLLSSIVLTILIKFYSWVVK